MLPKRVIEEETLATQVVAKDKEWWVRAYRIYEDYIKYLGA
jgi:3-oxoacyl-[acyl-carrier-protein] synthase III